nr:MAG: capsid protein [Cressdnaviricota sp.]
MSSIWKTGARRKKPATRRTRTTRTTRSTKKSTRRNKSAGTVTRQKDKSTILFWKAPNNSTFPQEWVTKIKTRIQFNCVIAAGNPIGANGAGRFYINSNSCISPFQNIVAATGLVYVNGFSAAANPVGFTPLCNATLFQRYQVLGAKLTVGCQPSLSSDQLAITITPSGTSSVPANVAAAYGQPFTKRGVHRSSNFKPNFTRMYVGMASFFGVDKKVFDNDIESSWSALYNAAPSNLVYYVVNLQLADGAVNSNTLPIEMELVQYVKYYAQDSANQA